MLMYASDVVALHPDYTSDHLERGKEMPRPQHQRVEVRLSGGQRHMHF